MIRAAFAIMAMSFVSVAVAGPPAPVPVQVINPAVPTMPGMSLKNFLFSYYYGQPANGAAAIPIGSAPTGQVFVLAHVTIQGYALTIGNPLHAASCSLQYERTIDIGTSSRSVGMIPFQINDIYVAGNEVMFLPIKSDEGLNVLCNADVPAGWNMMLSGYFVPATTL